MISKASLTSMWPAGLHLVASALYFGLSRMVVALWSYTDSQLWSYSPITTFGFPWRGRFEAYARWDAAWYFHIAERGYYFDGPGTPSAVAFFPAYPAVVRALGSVTGDPMVTGVGVTLFAGALALVLLHRWASAWFTPRAGALTVVLVVAAPYAYYLYGVMYSDALFLAAAVAAFLLLERRRPWLAALAGALATAGRPVGLAVSAGLLVRSLELDSVLRTRWSPGGNRSLLRLDLGRLRPRTLAPLASVAGMVGYSMLLWVRFDEPFAFLMVGSAEGWNRDLSFETVAKIDYLRLVSSGEATVQLLTTTISATLTLTALALLPAVLRRCGPAYFGYSLIVIALPLLTSPEFLGMGRYLLAAFPVFAVGASLLEGRRTLALAIPVVFTVLLGILATLFVRGYYLA